MDNTKRLYRSKTNAMFGGVAGGLAEYLEIDPSIVRLGFVALTLMGGMGPLIYLVLLIVLPENDKYESEPADSSRTDKIYKTSSNSNFWALLLIGAGVFLLVNQVLPLSRILGDIFWPMILIMTGVYLLTKR